MSKVMHIARGFMLGSMIVPAAGLCMHLGRYVSDDRLGGDYSLKNRFECAYSFKTPESHKTYTVTPVYNGYSGESHRENYLATPWATYPMMLILGLIGASSAIPEDEENKRARDREVARRKYTGYSR